MLASKLIVFAAAAALALGHVEAAAESAVHVRITKHHEIDKICLPNLTMVSVEGVGSFCAEGVICSGTTSDKGNCPKAQEGLEFGSHCGRVQSGVFGCLPNEKPSTAKPSSKPTDKPEPCGKPTNKPKPTDKPQSTHKPKPTPKHSDNHKPSVTPTPSATLTHKPKPVPNSTDIRSTHKPKPTPGHTDKHKPSAAPTPSATPTVKPAKDDPKAETPKALSKPRVRLGRPMLTSEGESGQDSEGAEEDDGSEGSEDGGSDASEEEGGASQYSSPTEGPNDSRPNGKLKQAEDLDMPRIRFVRPILASEGESGQDVEDVRSDGSDGSDEDAGKDEDATHF